MKLIQQLLNVSASYPIAIFQFKNGDFLVASFMDGEENNILLINPMMIVTTENETTGEEGLSLHPYMNPNICENANFWVERSDVFSIHQPTEKMIRSYIHQIMKVNVANSTDQKAEPKKKKGKKETANIVANDNNIVHVDFKNRSNSSNALVHIYKESDIFLDLPDEETTDPDPKGAA